MYKITTSGGDVKMSLSRTGGQGAKGDSITNIYADENNNLKVEISNSAGQLVETVNVGSINDLVASAVNAEVSSTLTGGTYQYMTVDVIDGVLSVVLDTSIEAAPDTIVVRDSDGTIHASKLHVHTDTPDDTSTEGQITWNGDDGTLNVVMKGENVVLQVGQEQLLYVYNAGTNTIDNGSVVYLDGAAGGRLSVALATNADEAKAEVIGIATEEITPGNYGYITTHGLVRDLDTSLLTEGAPLYLGIDGLFTDVMPISPAEYVKVGYVVKSDALTGTVYVNIRDSGEIGELHDVKITSPQTGEMLIYNATTGLWENGNPDATYATDSALAAVAAAKADAGHTHAIGDLSNVDGSYAIDNGYLKYISVDDKWYPATPLISDIQDLQTELDGKSDVTHLHDDRYYTETEIDALLLTSGHNHDDRYYSEAEIDAQMALKSDVGHTHTKSEITDFNEADYATAAQGVTADSAIQPGDNISQLTNDSAYISNITQESLADLSDTQLALLAEGQVLQWDATASKWINSTLTKADISDFVEADYEPADATILKDADIGLTVQGFSNRLQNIKNLTLNNNQFIFNNSLGVISAATVTDFALTLLDDGTAAQMRATIGAEPADATILKDADIGVNVQAYNSFLTTQDATFTSTLKTKLDGIEENAQVNTVSSVNGLIGDLELKSDNISDLYQTNRWFTAAERTKLTGIETLADVTDATNVAAAGAVMYTDADVSTAGWIIDEDDMVSDSATKVPTQQSVKAYVDGRIVSSVDYQGSYDAATNIPDLDTSPSGITKGNMYTVTVAGNFFTVGVEVGDVLIAEIDNPTVEADWTIVNKNLDAASIKTSYESNSDTNAFTDALLSKLNAIEAGATADQTPAEILTAIKTVDGATSGLDADLLDGQEGAYYLDYNNATNKPTSIAQLTTARDITLSGVVTGTASFDGTADANITVTSNMSLDNLTNVTETGKATNDYLRWTGTTWEGDHVRATDVAYDNTGSTLDSTTVKAALDELDSNKVNVEALNANLVVYPTTTASDITNYYKGVTSTTDPDYDTVAANVSTGAITGTGQLVASIASVAGILTGDPGVVVTSTVARLRRTAGTGTATFYYELYHRDVNGTETLLATSSETDPVSTGTYTTYSATAIMSGGTAFTETCRLVVKWFANQKTTSDPTYDIEFGGATPARITIPVPLSTLATTSTAASVSVDTTNFTGYLAGTDANVQAALEQLDSFQGSTTDVASTLVQRGSDNQFDITGIDFTTSHSLAGGVGRLVWNDTDGTLDLGLKGGNATLQVGQETVVRVYNGTGAAIPDGKVVAVTGATGAAPTIVLADASNESHSHTTLGVATETIASSSYGFMTVIGLVRGINTSAFPEGTALYLSTTPGEVTSTEPTNAHVIAIGTVVVSNATTGSIFVQPKPPLYEDLWRLEDVTITNPVAEQFLKYNGSVWVNADIPQINTLDDIGDVTITSATADQFLKWSGSAWVNADIPQINSVGDIADVTITSIGSGELLKWNGTGWVNNTLAEAGISAVGHTHAAADVISGTFADARIAQSNVTQHEGALSIGWSQLTSVPTYDNYVSWSFSATDTQVISSGETVSFSGSGSVSVSNTGNAITISGTDTTYSAGNGIGLSGTTFSVAAGSGLTQDASGLSHADTSTQASVNNSNGTVIQDITLDGFGHITAVGSVNLDSRYYTETEADARFVNTTGDTMTGALTMDGAIIKSNINTVNATSASTAIDMTSGNFHIVNMSADTVFSFSNLASAASSSGTIIIKQDATGGRDFTLPTEAKTPVGGATINQVTTANTTSILTYVVVSSTEVLVNYIGDFA